MLAPPQIFAFTRAQDMVSQHFEVLRRSQAATQLGTTNVASVLVYTVPEDRALWMGEYFATNASTVSSNVNAMGIMLSYVDRGEGWTINNSICAANFVGGQIATASGRWLIAGGTCDVVVPGGHDVYVHVMTTISAPVDEAWRIGISGILTPRGNVLTA